MSNNQKSTAVINLNHKEDADESGSIDHDDELLPTRERAILNFKRLHPVIRKRVKALKKLQFESFKVEVEFQRELHAMERKYMDRFNAYNKKRCDILTGKIEPTEEECHWSEPECDDDEDDIDKIAIGFKNITTNANNDEDKTTDKTPLVPKHNDAHGDCGTPDLASTPGNGIPSFWLTIFDNVDMLSAMLQPHDRPILEHLIDISTEAFDADDCRAGGVKKPGFRLNFTFSENDYFTDTVLTKDYFLQFEMSTEHPLDYDGPEIVQCCGCEIHWKKDKNVTVKLIKKVQHNKKRGEKRSVTKTVKNDSFFNFFSPPDDCLGSPNVDMDEEVEALLTSDFEIGQYLRIHVVPRAVLLFTGEGLENDFDDITDEEEEDGEEDEEDESDEPEEEERFHNRKVAKGKGK